MFVIFIHALQLSTCHRTLLVINKSAFISFPLRKEIFFYRVSLLILLLYQIHKDVSYLEMCMDYYAIPECC
jgi:hypothetical protein